MYECIWKFYCRIIILSYSKYVSVGLHLHSDITDELKENPQKLIPNVTSFEEPHWINRGKQNNKRKIEKGI